MSRGRERKFERVGDLAIGAEPGAVYAGRSTIVNLYGEQLDLIHVISRHAGGEIRGYVSLEGGPWLLRHPNYTGDWPEMDRAVEATCGITVSS